MRAEKISAELYTKLIHSHPETRFPIEQSPLWGEFQSTIPGRRSLGTFLIRQNEQEVALLNAVELTMRGYSYIWLNQGPTWLVEPTQAIVDDVAKTLRDVVAEASTARPLFIRAHFPKPPAKGLPAYSKSLIEKTTVVDLTPDFETILERMDYGARRGMRKAAKSGITIREVPALEAAADFAPYYAILSETASRDGFYVHPASTYQSMLKSLDGTVRFFVAFEGASPIAWAIDTVFNNQAIYYYGASNEAARKVSAPYLLHVEIMRQLKDEGVRSYDFLGIGSKNYPGLQGVTQFKLRFGGEVIEYVPAYDIPLQPLYHPWKWAQALKTRLRH
ncbi:MAG TPA: peptidoglycan bridge formation glycyltransferase FemA/FemB family protein [Candidatus Saccharimonadales bacterium]|nr:peptidoglycan bridge formation glycyltransferase FemA/FemB family protein [Candidatus Saccharimonadales bacterium]